MSLVYFLQHKVINMFQTNTTTLNFKEYITIKKIKTISNEELRDKKASRYDISDIFHDFTTQLWMVN